MPANTPFPPTFVSLPICVVLSKRLAFGLNVSVSNGLALSGPSSVGVDYLNCFAFLRCLVLLGRFWARVVEMTRHLSVLLCTLRGLPMGVRAIRRSCRKATRLILKNLRRAGFKAWLLWKGFGCCRPGGLASSTRLWRPRPLPPLPLGLPPRAFFAPRRPVGSWPWLPRGTLGAP